MITRSERSGEKRNRIFSPGRRNRREKKLPFRLSFITKGDGGRVYPVTRFVNGEEAVLEESAGVSLVEIRISGSASTGLPISVLPWTGSMW